MSERPQNTRGRGGGRGDRGGVDRGDRESRGGRGGGGGGRGGAQQAQTERPKKENILDLGKYMDKKIVVKFNGGREGMWIPNTLGEEEWEGRRLHGNTMD